MQHLIYFNYINLTLYTEALGGASDSTRVIGFYLNDLELATKASKVKVHHGDVVEQGRCHCSSALRGNLPIIQRQAQRQIHHCRRVQERARKQYAEISYD
jgi:hypothetical protein